MDLPLDRGAGKGDSLGDGLGTMGLAIADTKDHPSPVQLALVVGGNRGGAPRCGVAQPFLYWRAAGDRIASSLGRHSQTRRKLFAGDCLLGSSFGVVRGVVEP
jgi:hypothetical protein